MRRKNKIRGKNQKFAKKRRKERDFCTITTTTTSNY